MLNGLARYLTGQGHDVTIVSSKPGRAREIVKDGVRIIYNREYSHAFIPSAYKYQLLAWPFFLSFMGEHYDIIQSLFYIDAFGISYSKYFRNNRCIFYVPDGNIFEVKRRVDRYMIARTMRSADAVVVPSRYIQELVKQQCGLEGLFIPPGVDTGYFLPNPAKDLERPTILCMAELGMPRKRIPLLVRAFELFKKSEPDAILRLSGRIDDIFKKILLELAHPDIRSSILISGVGKEEDIPRLYANATMTVLPSLKEAFGMVLIESLSAGTPVVGTRDGGIPEIINDPKTGVLFDGDESRSPESLCDAMLRCLEIARTPGTQSRCREHGKKYDWSVIGSELQKLYERILTGHGS